jgi:hypothetical protein
MGLTIGEVLAHKGGGGVTMPKKWMGEKPVKCDMCHGTFGKFFFDAATRWGWGLICQRCFKSNKCSLGLGRGQKYDSTTLEKVDG